MLGVFPHEKVDLELKPDTKPILCKTFAIPNKLLPLLKKEVKKLVELTVLRPRLTSKWAFPTFLVPKKDGTATSKHLYSYVSKIFFHINRKY